MSRRLVLSNLSEPVYLRAITDADIPFLETLYAQTRAEEMQVVPWTDAEKTTFLRGQFEAQHKHYQDNFTRSNFDIIEQNDDAIGRLYVDRRDDEIRLIDIALLISARRKGLGGALIRQILDEADGKSLPVRLHVEQHNPAYGLYKRLGFADKEDRGVYMFMERPAQQ